MELRQLNYFRTAARLQHVTRAAEELCITQPTLSKAISSLEQELGVKLFDRVGVNIRLNPYGQLLLTRTNELFAHVEDTKNQIASLSSGERGEVTFASSAPEMLGPFIESYLREHPAIHIHQILADAEYIQSLLIKRLADFAITVRPIESAQIIWEPIRRETMGALLPVSHPLADRGSIALNELKDEPFLVNNSNRDLSEIFIGCCVRAGFYPNILFEGDQPDLIASLAADGYGVSFCSEPRYFKMRENAAAQNTPMRLIYVPLHTPDCYWTLGLCTLRDSTLLSAADAFRDHLVEELRNAQVPSEQYQSVRSRFL